MYTKNIKNILASALLMLCTLGLNAQDTISTPPENNLLYQLSEEMVSMGNNVEIERRELTAAVGSVSGKELEKMNTISPANSLYGLIPGLTVLRNSGSASWRDPNLYIRGLNTIGNRSILILIDGIEGDIARLSTLSIEKVEVLKDASALALYGQRGANGVLLVTTKRGKNQKMKVDIHLETGIHQATSLPKLVDAATYAERVNEALGYDGLPLKYSKDAIAKYRSGAHPSLYPNVNWAEEAYLDWGNQTALNMAFTGGDDKVSYFAELDYRAEDGLYTQDHNNGDYSTQLTYDRINFRTNIDVELTQTTDFKVWVSGGIDETNQPGAGTSATNIAIINTPSAAFPIKNYNGNWGGTATNPNNPIAMMTSAGYVRYQGFDMLLKGTLEQDMSALAKGLSAEMTVGYNMRANSSDGSTQSYLYEDLQYKEATATAPADTVSLTYGQNTPLKSTSGIGKIYRNASVLGKLNYDKSIGEHTFNTFLMYSQSNYVGKGHKTTYRRQNIAANIHYAYDKKYFADLTMNYGGTSVLPSGEHFSVYPAISGGWLLSEESFIDNSNIVKFLKLRGSFGFAGNDRISQYTEDTQFTNVGAYYYTNNNTNFWAAGEGRLGGSPRTERAMMTNLGLDANLFGKLNITVDAFYNKRYDILVSSSGSVSTVLGASPSLVPEGEVENKGFETGITWSDQVGDFKYSATGQFSFSRSKIIEMGELPVPYDYLGQTGNSIGQAYGLETNGFFNDATDIANSHPQMFSSLTPGDVKYVDQNGDQVIDELDVIPMFSNTICPEIYYSLNLNAEYKGFGINALLQGAANYTAYLNTASVYMPLINNTNISEFSNNRWTEATKNTATLPRLTTLDNDNNYRPNDIWLADRSFLKIRNVELYYNLSLKEDNKLKLNNVTFFLRGTNLYSFDKIEQMDPETPGINYPATSTYNMGVKLNF